MSERFRLKRDGECSINYPLPPNLLMVTNLNCALPSETTRWKERGAFMSKHIRNSQAQFLSDFGTEIDYCGVHT